MAIAHQITAEESALIEQFHAASNARGFDGVYSLNPVDRGVLAVAELSQTQTILKVLLELNLKGDDATKLFFGLRRHTAPFTEKDAAAMLNSILNDI